MDASNRHDFLIEWFSKNHEDAAHGVPRDGRGGYVYAEGHGPYDPMDVLNGAFPDEDRDVLEEAASDLRSSASAWVKKGYYS
jgi:hypothetical protein